MEDALGVNVSCRRVAAVAWLCWVAATAGLWRTSGWHFEMYRVGCLASWLAGQWNIMLHGCCMCTVVMSPAPFAAAAAAAAVFLQASQVSLPWLVSFVNLLCRRCTSPSRGCRLACCTTRLWMVRWPSLPQHAASTSRWGCAQGRMQLGTGSWHQHHSDVQLCRQPHRSTMPNLPCCPRAPLAAPQARNLKRIEWLAPQMRKEVRG